MDGCYFHHGGEKDDQHPGKRIWLNSPFSSRVCHRALSTRVHYCTVPT